MMPARFCIHAVATVLENISLHPNSQEGVIPKNALTIGQLYSSLMLVDFLDSSDSKASAYNAEDLGSIPGSGRSPGEGNGKPLQYSCLENPMDVRAW